MTINWTKQRILFELRGKGLNAAELAAQAGVSRYTVYGGLERPYPKVNDLISDALGVPRQVIWPQFYDAEGNRIGVIKTKKAA